MVFLKDKKSMVYFNYSTIIIFIEQDIIEAAKQANAHDFIISFQDGYNTLVNNKNFFFFYKKNLGW